MALNTLDIDLTPEDNDPDHQQWKETKAEGFYNVYQSGGSGTNLDWATWQDLPLQVKQRWINVVEFAYELGSSECQIGA